LTASSAVLTGRGMNSIALVAPQVTPPPDATSIHDWANDGDGVIERHFIGTCRPFGSGEVRISGFQATDGATQRTAYLRGPDSDELDAT
jgi:hypothetical protein